MQRTSTHIAQGITEVAHNLWWVWNPRAQNLFARLDPEVWSATRQNPLAVLRALSESDPAGLGSALEARDLLGEAQGVIEDFETYMKADDTWFGREGVEGLGGEHGPVAYFSAEFGLSAALPIYSGGLGVLAGDHIKAASDLGLPFVGIGMLYHGGYFQQRIDQEGTQSAVYPRLDLDITPARPVLDESGEQVIISMPVGAHELRAGIWRVDVGRAPLFLLDTNVDGNSDRARTITDNLYGGGTDLRIVQEILLGVGGVRALRAMGIDPAVWHLNEGHCAFLSLELIRERIEAGETFAEARDTVRDQCVFTTHTPVPAGHDRFEPELVERRFGWMAEALGLSLGELLAIGRVGDVEGQVSLDLPEPGEEEEETPAPSAPNGEAVEEEESDEPLCMTVLALRLTRTANGVSMVHGEVSRQMWSAMWKDRAASDVPIGHVTNGIHLPTWCSPTARAHLDPHLPADWLERQDDPELWLDLVDGISDADIWRMRQDLKAGLIEFINARWRNQAARFSTNGEVSSGAPDFKPEALTIGFARRFATYKRADLLFNDLDRAAKLFNDPARPLQIVFAGKAHPKDSGGQALIKHLVNLSSRPEFAGKVIVLEDYDMVMGRQLVSGVDVWLNNPRKPREASGTSGQKVAIHAGLNLSVLDGWWPEGFDGTNGFAIGDATPPVSPAKQDARDAAALYNALETQLLPLYFNRNDQNIPHLWLRRVRMAMKTLVGRYTTYRMVKDYARLFY